jgi:hypothetical protein
VLGTENFATSLYFCLSATIVHTAPGGIPCLHPISTAQLQASKSAIIFNFILKVEMLLAT